MRTIVTAGGRGADIDVFACATSYAELLRLEGKDALAVIPGLFTMSVTPSILEWGADYVRTHTPEETDHFVLVDISDHAHVAPFVVIPRVREVYDHRSGFEDYWKDRIGERAHIEMVGSCGTLIWEAFKRRGKHTDISMTGARLLLASIVSNTLNFRASITTERDRVAYSELKVITGLDEAWVTSYFLEQEQTLLKDFRNYLKADTKIAKTPYGEFVIGQIELWDADTVMNTRSADIDAFMEEHAPLPWFVNIPNIGKGFNYLYSKNPDAKRIVAEKLKVTFDGDIAKTERLMLRKEVMKILLTPS
jgi:inorganic pyrophosphatase/exopolyphosphatase